MLDWLAGRNAAGDRHQSAAANGHDLPFPCAVRILGEDDTLKAGDVVSGWSMPVQELLAA